ncbi:hypothetical protein BGW41_001103 [Actinomortierella wolfii]|nr:hypothetical protein BGW41_001103 [Actinomortierella wolfii]
MLPRPHCANMTQRSVFCRECIVVTNGRLREVLQQVPMPKNSSKEIEFPTVSNELIDALAGYVYFGHLPEFSPSVGYDLCAMYACAHYLELDDLERYCLAELPLAYVYSGEYGEVQVPMSHRHRAISKSRPQSVLTLTPIGPPSCLWKRQRRLALARVPQLWTSYSGNLREVKIMCMAISASLERDELYELHRNITRAHHIQIKLVEKQWQVLQEAQIKDEMYNKDLLEMHALVQHELSRIKSTTRELSETLHNMITDMHDAQTKTRDAATRREEDLVAFIASNNAMHADIMRRMIEVLRYSRRRIRKK